MTADAQLELNWAKTDWEKACRQICELAEQIPPFGADVFEILDLADSLRSLAQNYHDAHVKNES